MVSVWTCDCESSAPVAEDVKRVETAQDHTIHTFSSDTPNLKAPKPSTPPRTIAISASMCRRKLHHPNRQLLRRLGVALGKLQNLEVHW